MLPRIPQCLVKWFALCLIENELPVPTLLHFSVSFLQITMERPDEFCHYVYTEVTTFKLTLFLYSWSVPCRLLSHNAWRDTSLASHCKSIRPNFSAFALSSLLERTKGKKQVEKLEGVSLPSAVSAQLFLQEGFELKECTLIVSAVYVNHSAVRFRWHCVTAVRECDIKSTLVSSPPVCAAVNWWFWTFLQCDAEVRLYWQSV